MISRLLWAVNEGLDIPVSTSKLGELSKGEGTRTDRERWTILSLIKAHP
jgi:hypothetical protein